MTQNQRERFVNYWVIMNEKKEALILCLFWLSVLVGLVYIGSLKNPKQEKQKGYYIDKSNEDSDVIPGQVYRMKN